MDLIILIADLLKEIPEKLANAVYFPNDRSMPSGDPSSGKNVWSICFWVVFIFLALLACAIVFFTCF